MCNVIEYCWDALAVNFSNPKLAQHHGEDTSFQICKSNHTLFFSNDSFSLSLFFFLFQTGSTDARLQYLEESKRIKVSISITNVQLTVKTRSMRLLDLYTVKKQNLSSYLHMMKWIRGTDIFFSTTNEVSKEDVTLVLRQEAGDYILHELVSNGTQQCLKPQNPFWIWK